VPAEASFATLLETLRFADVPYESATGLRFFGGSLCYTAAGRFVPADASRRTISGPLSLESDEEGSHCPMAPLKTVGGLGRATGIGRFALEET
jgi:hypothetical protein